jgi:hypothetical protein
MFVSPACGRGDAATNAENSSYPVSGFSLNAHFSVAELILIVKIREPTLIFHLCVSQYPINCCYYDDAKLYTSIIVITIMIFMIKVYVIKIIVFRICDEGLSPNCHIYVEHFPLSYSG